MNTADMKTAVCRGNGKPCSNVAHFIGPPEWLVGCGWHIERDGEEFRAWCPMCHPEGIEASAVKARFHRRAFAHVIEAFADMNDEMEKVQA